MTTDGKFLTVLNMNTTNSAAAAKQVNEAATLGEIAKALAAGWKIRTVGAIQNALVIEPPFGFDGTLKQDGVWSISDNGGELNVARVNDGESYRPVATSAHGFALNAETIAYRVAMVLADEPIDYAYRIESGELEVAA